MSFEIFPPRKDAAFGPIRETVERLARQKPSFMSVTYGASGNACANTVEVASFEGPVGSYLLSLVPSGLMRVAARVLWVRPQIDAARCVSCGRCLKACPVNALVWPAAQGRGLPVLRRRACVGCACCHEVCPKGAIRMAQSPMMRLAHSLQGIS